MIKSFEKLKVRIDQNLNRAERSEALAEDAVKLENKVSCLKQVCQTVSKKLSDGLTSIKGNDGPAVEKRIRKTTEFALGQTFQENGRAYAQHEKPNRAAMSSMMVEGGLLLNDLASNQVQYEIGVEKLVLSSLSSIHDEHCPPIARERKLLSGLLLEFDAAKSKASDDPTKEEKLASELADVEQRLNHSRLSLETMMLQFLSRERDVGGLLLRYFELKRDHHAEVARRISERLEAFGERLDASSSSSPTFGCELGRHLDRVRSRIAFPLRLCVVRILQLDGLREEGLFRVAASGLRIRRLAALVDAGECGDEDASHANDVLDPHVFAGALKLYLRRLPLPLLCSAPDMYAEWISACSCSMTDRRGAIDALLHTLPEDNVANLRYLMAFLQHVHLNSDANKMTASNLSIVMAPNLLWPAGNGSGGGADQQGDCASGSFAGTSVVNDIVESLVSDFEYYFGDVQEVQLLKDPPCLIGRTNSGFQYKDSIAVLSRATAANKGHHNDSSDRQEVPPVQQRTPVPKPRTSRNKANPPPPPPPQRHNLPTKMDDAEVAAKDTTTKL